MRKISIILAENRSMIRQGMRARLEREMDFQVVGESGDGVETVKLVERLKPDILILDLTLPGLNGLDVTLQIRDRALPTRVVILTLLANEAYVLAALRNGACAYVLKDSPADELVRAVHEAAVGRKYLSRPLSEIRLKDHLLKSNSSEVNTNEILTARQREVVQLVAAGKSSREIGLLLGISRRTVETHRSQAMKTFGIKKQTELVRLVLQRGIRPADSLAGRPGKTPKSD